MEPVKEGLGKAQSGGLGCFACLCPTWSGVQTKSWYAVLLSSMERLGTGVEWWQVGAH